MELVWSHEDIAPADVDALLRAFPVTGDMPVFGRVGAKILFASRAALNLFGVHDLAALAAQLGGSDPGAARLAELATTLPVDGAPRLERLRLALPAAAETLTFLCRRLTREPEAIFVAAALNVRPDLLAEPAATHPAEPEATPPLPAKAPETEPATAEAAKAALAARAGPRRVRFLWRTDTNHVVTEVSPQLAEVVGARAANIVGHSLPEVARTLGLDPTGNLDRALDRRESWSGLQVGWPITNAAGAVAATLGALPGTDPDGAFEGYRGYGVLDIDRVTAAAAICRDEAPAAAALEPPPEPAAALAPDPVPLAANVVQLRVASPKPAPAAAPALSVAERSAFDQIAALLSSDEPGATTTAAVPPAPVHAALDIAQRLLAPLDIGVIIARDDVALAANRAALVLTGHADLASLNAADGIAGLFPALPGPDKTAAEIRTASGTLLPVQVKRDAIDWPGGAAELFTLQRPEPQAPAAVAAPETPRPDAETGELKTILDTATDGVVVLDGDGIILSLNRSGEALFGCDASEVIGAPFTELIAPDSQTRVRDYFDGVKAEGVASLLNDGREITGRTRQGGLIPMFVTLGRISAHGDAAVKFCALLRDLTQWKKVERELNAARQEAERASALKSDFLAKVSHEIRTPLNAILGFAEVIMDERFGPVGNDRYRDYLKDIHASGQHVMSLVNDLLDLSKIEAGKMELAVAAVDANQVITECVSLMQPQASRERVIMRLSLSPTLPQILADARSLKQIVLNLLSNAVKFNEPGGQVIVATTLTDTGHAVIRVRDTGIGMSDADIELALEPFRQVATTRATTGTGLGLPLTKALVEANAAYFEIKSRPKEGTLVEIVFPPARVLAKGEARS